jgi:hypothetical protein
LTHREGRCLRYSAYITAQSVKRHFVDRDRRSAALGRLKHMGITKAYVEVYRGGLCLNEDDLKAVRDSLTDAGFDVSGGIATTHGAGFTDPSTEGSHWICYGSPRSLENLRGVARRAARVFDEVIIDDFLCTCCRCDRCRELRGDREWSDYYLEAMGEYTEKWLIAPAKEENPRVRLIIKYPQWYDRFHVFGYDVVRESEAFDAVWVGTEIRDPRVDYVHQYEAFANYTYLRSVAGGKVEGAWFDFLWCYPEVYLEQAYQSVLAGARELILFSYSPELYDARNPNATALVGRRDLLEGMCRHLEGKVGLGMEAYKPPGGDSGFESFIFDYLGMLGLPALVRSSRPTASSVLLPSHALADPGISDHMAPAQDGGVVVATSGFLEGMAGRKGVLDLFGLSDEPVTRRNTLTYRFKVDGKTNLSEEAVLLRSYLRPSGARILAQAVTGRDYPILTAKETEGTTYVAACLDTFKYLPRHGPAKVTVAEPVSLVHLPQAVLDALRAYVLSPFGLVVNAPAKVGIYLYGLDSTEVTDIAVENFGDQEVEVGIAGPGSIEPALGAARLSRDQDTFSVRVPGREPALFSASTGH